MKPGWGALSGASLSSDSATQAKRCVHFISAARGSNSDRMELPRRLTDYPMMQGYPHAIASRSFLSCCPGPAGRIVNVASSVNVSRLDDAMNVDVDPSCRPPSSNFGSGTFRCRNAKQLAVELILRFSHQRNSAVVQADKLCVVATAHPVGCGVATTRLAGVSPRAPHKGSVPPPVDPPARRAEVRA